MPRRRLGQVERRVVGDRLPIAASVENKCAAVFARRSPCRAIERACMAVRRGVRDCRVAAFVAVQAGDQSQLGSGRNAECKERQSGKA